MSAVVDRVLSLIAPALCWSCGRQGRPGDPLCNGCRRSLRRLGPEPVMLAGLRVWAPLAYECPARALVRGLKYRGAWALAGPMAAQMAANAPPGLLHVRATLVPVPLHPARLRSRGFNQAELLAAALADRAGLALCDCLRRRGPATRQVGRDRPQRLTGPAGTIELAPDRPVPGNVVMVDDVATTGATLAVCADALRAAGARSVAAVTFARTPGR